MTTHIYMPPARSATKTPITPYRRLHASGPFGQLPPGFDPEASPIIAKHFFGLQPFGLIANALVFDLARRTGRLPRYYQLLNSSNCRCGNRAITRNSTA